MKTEMKATKKLSTHNGQQQQFAVKIEEGKVFYTGRSGKYVELKRESQIPRGMRGQLIRDFLAENKIELN